MMETGEIINEKAYASPRLLPKISFKNNWMEELGSEVAGHGESSQFTQSKTANPMVRTGRPVTTEQTPHSSAQEIDTHFLLGCESTNVSVERSDKDKDEDENVDADQIGTERPDESQQSIGLFTLREEIDIDFRVSGLPHAIVKQAENFRVRQLVKKIESHPHRRALQADLQPNNTHNLFSDDSKAMIRDIGNVELFELCETIPKMQCTECLRYWNQGVTYCTCGHLFVESESSQHFHQRRLDALSIPHYVIKKGTTSWCSARQNETQKQDFVVHNVRKRCVTKNFDGIHDRFQRGSVYRDSQLKIALAEVKCIAMDKLAQENHSYCPSSEEYEEI